MNNSAQGHRFCDWGMVLLVFALCGCQPDQVPTEATRVLQENQVKVQVDAQGRVQAGSAVEASAPAAESK